MRKLLCILLLLCLLAGMAVAESIGRSYEDFESLYGDNILFINENTGRHLLPLSFSRDYDSAGKRLYRLLSGALDVEIHLDDTAQQIATCRITLTAPANMQYNSSQHHDFATSGYHCYALMMAMAEGASACDRYALVAEVTAGLDAASDGLYQTQAGDYRLSCTRTENAATMLFENQLLAEEDEEEIILSDEDAEEAESEEDAFLG